MKLESTPDRPITKRDKVALNRQRANEIESNFGDNTAHHLIVDCSFNHLMDEFEKSSLTVQLQQCYSHLRHAGGGRAQMFVSSATTELRDRIVKQGGGKWAIHLHSEDMADLVPSLMDEKGNSQAIVMSPDASEELTPAEVMSMGSIFVIGGIVDRSVSRNETCHKAIRLGMNARRLPVDPDRFINKVFNIDSVFLFLLKCFSLSPSTRGSMVDILESVLPDRKKKQDDPIPPRPNAPARRNSLDIDPSNTVKLDRYSVLDVFR